MLKIKLARFGKRNQPHYRVVINEARDKRDGSYVENIGHYAPTQTPKVLVINKERYKYWISMGAQPTDTVATLFKKSQSKDPFPPRKKRKASKKKKKEQKKSGTTPAEKIKATNDQPTSEDKPATKDQQTSTDEKLTKEKKTEEKVVDEKSTEKEETPQEKTTIEKSITQQG